MRNTPSPNKCPTPLNLASFVELSKYSLQSMDEAIIGVDKRGRDYDAITHIINLLENIFTPARQLKLDAIVEVTLELKSYLQQIKRAEVPINSHVVLRLFSCRYLLSDLISELSDKPQLSAKDRE